MFQIISVFVSLTLLNCAECVTEKVYLNSYKSCSREIHEVSLKKDYIVLPDITPETKTRSFRDCEVTFSSNKEYGGHICLMQTGNRGIIKDPNAQLEAKDGVGDSNEPEIDNIKLPKPWTVREYCSTSPYITLYLKEIQKEVGADIRNVHIEFRVVDIESRERVLYLDGNYCDKKYKLLNSQVTLWNRPQFPGMTMSTLTSECGIGFKKLKQKQNTTMSHMCFAYVPSENVNCESRWRFVVSIEDFSLDEEHIRYSLRCNDSKANTIHVWCAEPDVSLVTVIFWRNDNILSNSSVEASKMFRYVVRDYTGTEEQFLSEVKAMFATDSNELFNIKGWVLYVIIGLGVFILALVVCGICYWKKRKPSYKEVDTESSKAI